MSPWIEMKCGQFSIFRYSCFFAIEQLRKWQRRVTICYKIDHTSRLVWIAIVILIPVRDLITLSARLVIAKIMIIVQINVHRIVYFSLFFISHKNLYRRTIILGKMFIWVVSDMVNTTFTASCNNIAFRIRG